MVCTLATPAWAADNAMQPPVPEAAAALLDFDIPALPLDDALGRYAAQSRRSTLFRSATVQGRISSAVQGRHSPGSALRLLLEGTGLAAESMRDGPADAFVLKPVDARALAARTAADGVDTDYGAWVQARVWQALCADARTAPGSYRTLLRFEVDATGALQKPRLLTSTGNARRDAAVREALQRVRVDRAPPPAMAQPLTLVLLPRDPTDPDAPRCENRP